MQIESVTFITYLYDAGEEVSDWAKYKEIEILSITQVPTTIISDKLGPDGNGVATTVWFKYK